MATRTTTRARCAQLLLTGLSFVPFVAATPLAAQTPPAIDQRVDVGYRIATGFGLAGRVVVDSTDHAYVSAAGSTYRLTRIRPNGGIAWQREVLGVGTMKAFDVAVDGQDNAVVIGYDQGTFSFVTTKYAPDGTELWSRVRKDGLRDEGFRVAMDAAGNSYVTGHSTNASTFAVEFMTIKYDPAGNELWLRRATLGQPRAIDVTPSGRVVVTGDGGNSFATISYDTDGNELWRDVFSSMTQPYDGLIDDNGSVFVCGAGGPALTGVVVHYAPSGAIEWIAQNTGPFGGWDLYRGMDLDPSGDIVVAGQAFGVGYLDWTTTKFDRATGGVLWSRTHTGFDGNDEIATDVKVGADGSVYTVGFLGPDLCPGGPLVGLDATIVKYDVNGELVWQRQIPCAGASGTLDLDGRGGASFTVASDEVVRVDPACAGLVGSETPRFGSPPNPFAFKPATSGPPSVGFVWDPIIDHNVFAPTALIDFVAISTNPGINLPTASGTLLIDPPPAPQIFFNSRVVRRVYVPVPAGCGLAGATATAQAGAWSPGVGFELTNALDIVIGTM